MIHRTFFHCAPAEVLRIIYAYAEHMDRIHECEVVVRSCLYGFMWDLRSHAGLTQSDWFRLALAFAQDRVHPAFARLEDVDSKEVLFVMLSDRVTAWAEERVHDIYQYMVTTFPPVQTAFKMRVYEDGDGWADAISAGNLPLAVASVWSEIMVPHEVALHHLQFIAEDYREAVEACLLEEARREYWHDRNPLSDCATFDTDVSLE